ncbi:hypothetical protein EVAR_95112_1 [Eumeta japonica]|uniref:Uncharacterized protein n=1 Tax=Eumeta variegata TaxID=151549 RepID=A0A4C2AAY4_EUMVA|nr:hypothetical protein EVAR_95112_1 [Eumeta japonica]
MSLVKHITQRISHTNLFLTVRREALALRGRGGGPHRTPYAASDYSSFSNTHGRMSRYRANIIVCAPGDAPRIRFRVCPRRRCIQAVVAFVPWTALICSLFRS